MTKTQTRYSDAALMRLPHDGYKCELIEGELVMAPAGMEHEDVGACLLEALRSFVRVLNLGRVYGSSAGYRLPDGDVLCPDVSLIRSDRLPGGRSPKGFSTIPPDLAVEILSPSDSRRAAARKARRYLVWGTKLVWVIDPEARTVTVHRPGREPRVIGVNGRLDGEDVVPGFVLPVRRLFE